MSSHEVSLLYLITIFNKPLFHSFSVIKSNSIFHHFIPHFITTPLILTHHHTIFQKKTNMKIKTAELFCASPASTAICTTMNQHAMVRRGGGSTPRPIHHRHHDYYNNHYQFDFGDKPKFKTPAIPCTSQQHIDPKPYTTYLQKHRKSTSTTLGKTTSTSILSRNSTDNNVMLARRKSSNVELNDRKITRGSSSKYLLNNNPIFFEELKEKESSDVINAGALVVSDQVWLDYSHDDIKKSNLSSRRVKLGDDSAALVKSSRSSSSIRLDLAKVDHQSPNLKSSRSRSRDQVCMLVYRIFK